jgi:molecular chaperone Hsp33
MIFKDQSQRFIFYEAPVRGEIVNLSESYQEILKRSPYPLAVQTLLGQALVAVSLLSATIKYQGSIILQTQSNGPVSLLLAQANSMYEIRGLAKWQGHVSDEFNAAVGSGHLAITIEPATGSERYQGLVELKGLNLAQVIENYFHQSEQLPTFVMLAANASTAAGILLQLLPQAKHEDKNFWEHVEYLSRTLTSEELLTLAPEQILYRLFNQEKVSVFDPKAISFVCRCSRDAMARAIMTLGHEDAVRLANEHQVVSVTCEFCNKQTDFDRIDVERIFNDNASGEDRILH